MPLHIAAAPFAVARDSAWFALPRSAFSLRAAALPPSHCLPRRFTDGTWLLLPSCHYCNAIAIRFCAASPPALFVLCFSLLRYTACLGDDAFGFALLAVLRCAALADSAVLCLSCTAGCYAGVRAAHRRLSPAARLFYMDGLVRFLPTYL